MPPGSKKRRAAAKKKKGSGSHTNNNHNKNDSQQPQIHGDEDLKHHDGKESEGEDGGSPSSHDLASHQHQSTDEEKEDSGRTDDIQQVQSTTVENNPAEENKENGPSVKDEVHDKSIASEEFLKDAASQKESDNGVQSQPVNEEAIVQIESKCDPSKKLDQSSTVQDNEHATESSDNINVDESHVLDNVNVVVDGSPFASSTEAANMVSEGLTQVVNTFPLEDTHGSLVESGVDTVSGYSGRGEEQVSVDSVTSGDSSAPVKGETDENADLSMPKDHSSVAPTLEDPGFADDNDEAAVGTNAAVGVPYAKSCAIQERKEVFISDISRRDEIANAGTVDNGTDSKKHMEVNDASVTQPLLGSAAQPVQKTSWMSCCGILDVLAGSSR